MAAFPPALQELVRAFSKLPSLGEKSATRIALALVTHNRQLATQLRATLETALNSIALCPQCFFIAENGECSVCGDPGRDQLRICVVEKPSDVVAIERLREYRGLYHVLHGVWAPLKGMGPESMKLAELLTRVDGGGMQEVIVATSSTIEGEATALFLAEALKKYSVPVTRLAQGMSRGGELEFADDFTLSRAFAGRSVLS